MTHFKTPDETELGLVALLLGLSGYIGLGLAHYLSNKPKQAGGPLLETFHRFLYRGWYFDKSYELLFNRPFKALTELLANKLPKLLSRSEQGLSRLDLIVFLTVGGLGFLFIFSV